MICLAVTDEVNEYLRRLREGETMAGYQPFEGQIVAKGEVSVDGEYNLSSESTDGQGWTCVEDNGRG